MRDVHEEVSGRSVHGSRTAGTASKGRALPRAMRGRGICVRKSVPGRGDNGSAESAVKYSG